MRNRWIGLLVAIALPCVAAAQPPSPPAPATNSANAGRQAPDGPTFVVEIAIVEGVVAPDSLAAKLSVPSTFEDLRAGEATLPRSNPPKTIDEEPRSKEADQATSRQPSFGSASGEIVLPAPMLPEPASEPRRPSLRDAIAAVPEAAVLSAPTLTVVEGQEATVYVATQQRFDYLVPSGDGKYEVRQSEPYELGIRLNLTVRSTEDEESVALSPLQIEVTSLDGREPVKGTNLDAGRPIISSRSLKTTVPVTLGDDRLIPIPSGPERQAAIILRLNRLDPNGEKETRQPIRSPSGDLERKPSSEGRSTPP